MLPNRLRQLEEENIYIHKIFLFLRKLNTNLANIKFEILAYLRHIGISNNKYSKLRNMKHIHEGERCFIIATGPSLTIEDINKLTNEYTLSMNSICLALDNTDWRPTYYGIQDEHVYKKLEKKLKNSDLKNIFVSSNIAKKHDVLKWWIEFPLNIEYHSFQQRFYEKYFVKFSDDCYKAVYDGFSITYSLIQLAIYMGFKEIYLVGADCNYENGKKHHFIEHGHFDPTFSTAKDRMLVGYEKVKEYVDANGVKIYNATRGGMLEVFPRVDLDEILGVKEND